eukprot:s1258_g17.t1
MPLPHGAACTAQEDFGPERMKSGHNFSCDSFSKWFAHPFCNWAVPNVLCPTCGMSAATGRELVGNVHNLVPGLWLGERGKEGERTRTRDLVRTECRQSKLCFMSEFRPSAARLVTTFLSLSLCVSPFARPSFYRRSCELLDVKCTLVSWGWFRSRPPIR